MTTLSASARCLGHGCEKLDHCLRHLAIRQPKRPEGDVDVFENACAVSSHARVPLVADMPSFNHDRAWREAHGLDL